MNPIRLPAVLAHTFVTALTPILWGSTYLLASEVLSTAGPMTIAMARSLPAGLLLLVATRPGLPDMPWHRLLVLSLLNITAFQALLFYTAQRLPGGIAALVGSLQPVLLMLLIWWFDRRRPHPIAVGASILGIAGVWMILMRKEADYDPAGMLAGFAGTLCMATGTFLHVRWRGQMAPVPLIGWQLLIGGMVLLVPAFMIEELPARWTLPEWAGFGYLVLFGTAAAYAIWFRGLSLLPQVAVSALGLLSPLTALLLGWSFLGQTLGTGQLLGVAAVLTSVTILQSFSSSATQPTGDHA